MKKDRNGEIHKSGIDNPNFALDNPFAVNISDGHNEEWFYKQTEHQSRKLFNELKNTETDIHLCKYNKDVGYEVIDSFNNEE